jgi:ATP-dependent NAD(P)H-hydrate dehydratase
VCLKVIILKNFVTRLCALMISNSYYNYKNKTKGQNGSVLIIGGCDLYTGAPYTSALSAFLTGTDLVYIFSGKESILSLKTLLPEAIVSQIKYEEWILRKINVCILGPGLGVVENTTTDTINKILRYLGSRSIPLIVDADGIRNIDRFDVETYKNIIYTPNKNEAKFVKLNNDNQFSLYKGIKDIIVSGDITIEIEDRPCSKRCGGQGDILNGILASLLIKLKDGLSREGIIRSMCISSRILRKAGYLAYENKGVSTMSRDILEKIPDVINNEKESF